ncbi:MAG: DUF342 domain-containing protein, partial [Lachnospiraceae bacterium]|nr:DUF342 domain-containing protein [Lachnospiraceae bacterium]
IELSEDGTELRSAVNGNVSLINDTIFVKDVYEVKDVDTATGNIDYKGDVLVAGNVLGGFSVKATGTVEVKGVVEGAKIEAGEDIIIGRGMNGMGKGELKAGRNIVAKFFENAKITAGGYIRSDAIINSEVSAGTDIEVNGKKGNITGGGAIAGGIIAAKTLGSEMGIETRIEVGSDPSLKAQVISLEGDIAKLNKAIEQINPVLVAYTQRLKRGEKLTEEQLTQMKQMSAKFKALSGALEKENVIYESLNKKLKESSSAEKIAIKVSGVAYPGTVIVIQNATKELHTETQHSRFVREGADVRIKALY